MAGHPLELTVDRSPALRAWWRLDAGCALDRLGERGRIGAGRDSRDTFGDVHADLRGQAVEPRFDAAVLEERAGLQPRDVLAAGLDLKLDRLKDSRSHRAVRDRERIKA